MSINYLVIFILLLSSYFNIAFAGNGGDVKISNQTSYPFQQEHTDQKGEVSVFNAPQIVDPGTSNNIYFEIVARTMMYASATVFYNVNCPDNHIDQFMIQIIKPDGIREAGYATVSQVRDEPLHCINIEGNDGIFWHWNGLHLPVSNIIIKGKNS